MWVYQNKNYFLSLLDMFNLYTTINSPIRISTSSQTCISNIIVSKTIHKQLACGETVIVDFSDHNAQIVNIRENNLSSTLKKAF